MSSVDRSPVELGILLEACRDLFQRILRIRRASPEARDAARVREALGYAELAVRSLGPDGEEGSTDAAGMAERLLDRAPRPETVSAKAQPDPFDPDEESRPDLRGDARCVSLPDIIGFLQVQSKSGVMRIRTQNEVFSLGFEDGDVVCAYSDNTPAGSRLAEILVQQGAIESEKLGAFLIDHSSRQGRLGEALESESLVTRAQLCSALEEQVQHLFVRLFESEDATFVFLEGNSEPVDETIRLSVLKLLLEGARLQDEASRD